MKQGNIGVTKYDMKMVTLWQKLDSSSDENWECKGDSICYKLKLDSERVFEFLLGLNHELDEVRGRILDRRPLPPTREVFSKVCREEGRRTMMLRETGDSQSGSTLNTIGLLDLGWVFFIVGFPQPKDFLLPVGLMCLKDLGLLELLMLLSLALKLLKLISCGPLVGLKLIIIKFHKKRYPWCEHYRKNTHKRYLKNIRKTYGLETKIVQQ